MNATQTKNSMGSLTDIITAADTEVRNRSLDAVCERLAVDALLAECEALEHFRRSSSNLYERVRALFFLYAIHRFHMPLRKEAQQRALIPFAGYERILNRRFEEAIEIFRRAQAAAASPAIRPRSLGSI